MYLFMIKRRSISPFFVLNVVRLYTLTSLTEVSIT